MNLFSQDPETEQVSIVIMLELFSLNLGWDNGYPD